MRLVKLHVDNFGILRNLDWQFGPGLNIINRENGWGKSTFASFLAVMFYGFLGEGKRSELENERARFRPWQGGPYGGSVVFEAGGKTYRLERQFGLRAREDSFALYDEETGLRSTDYSDPVGEELFHVDRISFERTVFVAQLSAKTSVTSAIHARIGSLDAYTDDMNRYGQVMDELKSRMTGLSPQRKTGLIARKNAELFRLEEELREKDKVNAEAAAISRTIADEQERLETLERELSALRNRAEELSADKDKKAEEERIRTIREERIRAAREDIAESERELAAAEEYFPGRIPEAAELKEIRELANLAAGRESALESIALTGGERERLEKLVLAFHAGVPEEKTFTAWRKKEEEIRQLERWMEANRLTEQEKQELRETAEVFGGEIPSGEQFARYQELYEEERSIRQSVAARKKTMEEMRRAERPIRPGRGKAGAVMALVYGLILLAAGIALLLLKGQARETAVLFFRSVGAGDYTRPAGIILALLGTLLLVLSTALFLRRGAENARFKEHLERQDIYGQMERENEGDEAEAEKLAEVIDTFLSGFHPSSGGDMSGREDITGGEAENPEEAPETAESVSAMLDRYAELAARGRRLREKERIYEEACPEERRDELARGLSASMDRYFPEESGLDFGTRTVHIWEAASEYRALSRKHYDYAAERKRQRQNENLVRDFLASLEMEPGKDLQAKLLEIHDYVTERNQCAEELKRKKAMYAELLDGGEDGDSPEKMADDREPGDGEALNGPSGTGEDSLAGLNEQIRSLEEEKNRTAADIRDNSYRLFTAGERIKSLREREEEAQETKDQISRLEKRLSTLELTAEYLEKARAALMVRYAEPVRKAFLRYYRMLEGENPEAWAVDAELSVKVREMGKYRDPEFLSAGRRDLAGLCRRMAMAEAMYPEEKPFLLMDDPFVNLDEKRREAGIRFLRTVGKDWQVIYFTCQGVSEYIKR